VKSTDEYLQSPCPEFPRKICRPGKLVRLDSDQSDDRSPVRKPVGLYDSADRYFLYGIVDELDFELNFSAKQSPPGYVLREAREASQGIAGKHAAKMPDYISFIIVLGWLYENDFN
jgi:hypothetical protein